MRELSQFWALWRHMTGLQEKHILNSTQPNSIPRQTHVFASSRLQQRWLTCQVGLWVDTLRIFAGLRTSVGPAPQTTDRTTTGHSVHTVAPRTVVGDTLHLLTVHLQHKAQGSVSSLISYFRADDFDLNSQRWFLRHEHRQERSCCIPSSPPPDDSDSQPCRCSRPLTSLTTRTDREAPHLHTHCKW